MPPKMQAGPSATAVALQADKNATRVFVGGLRKTTSEDRIFAHFAKFGEVNKVELKRQPNGESRGFAFVKFVHLDTVDKVMEARTQHMIDNKWVDVKRHDNNASSSAPASVVAWGAKGAGAAGPLGAVAGTGVAYAEDDEDEARQDEDKMAAQSMLQAAFANEMNAMQATQQSQHGQQADNTSTVMGAASASPAELSAGMGAAMGASMSVGGGMMPMGMMPMGMMPMGNGMGVVMMPMMPGMMGMMNPAMMGMMNPAMIGTQGAQTTVASGGECSSAGVSLGGGCAAGQELSSVAAVGGDFGPTARNSVLTDRPSPY